MTEKELDLAFAEQLKSSEEFQCWLLGKTDFATSVGDARLLHAEQAAARTSPSDPRFWYRYWWCKLPDGKDSETDILAVFERPSNKQRFALHIENKPPKGKFTKGQPGKYPLRAEFMANGKFKYSEWRTVLIAPEEFRVANSNPEEDDRCDLFDHFISYEQVGNHVPQFRQALPKTAPSTDG